MMSCMKKMSRAPCPDHKDEKQEFDPLHLSVLFFCFLSHEGSDLEMGEASCCDGGGLRCS